MNDTKMQTIRMQTEKIRNYVYYVRAMNRILNELLTDNTYNLSEADFAYISEVNMIYTKRLFDCIATLYHTVEMEN